MLALAVRIKAVRQFVYFNRCDVSRTSTTCIEKISCVSAKLEVTHCPNCSSLANRLRPSFSTALYINRCAFTTGNNIKPVPRIGGLARPPTRLSLASQLYLCTLRQEHHCCFGHSLKRRKCQHHYPIRCRWIVLQVPEKSIDIQWGYLPCFTG